MKVQYTVMSLANWGIYIIHHCVMIFRLIPGNTNNSVYSRIYMLMMIYDPPPLGNDF